MISVKRGCCNSSGMRNCSSPVSSELSRHALRRCPVFHRDKISVVTSARPGRNSLPETVPRRYLGAWNSRGNCFGVARSFTATKIRLSLRRGHAETHCPKLYRGVTSVHGIAAATVQALSGLSPRQKFGWHFGAAGACMIHFKPRRENRANVHSMAACLHSPEQAAAGKPG